MRKDAILLKYLAHVEKCPGCTPRFPLTTDEILHFVVTDGGHCTEGRDLQLDVRGAFVLGALER